MSVSIPNSVLDEAHVLIVDDDPGVREAYTRMLTRIGCSVEGAESYEAAAALLQAQAFDVIVSDICLGDEDGIVLLERCRDLSPDTPVILATGMPTLETASAAVRLNAYDYLLKPVSKNRLCHVVGKAVEVKRLKAEKQKIELENQQYQRDLERLVAERTSKLMQSNLRYQLLFENSKDAIFMASSDGRFLALNEAAVQMFGHDRETLLNDSAIGMCAAPQQYNNFQREIEKNGFVKDFNVKFNKKDGSVIDCLLTANLLNLPEEGIKGYQGIIRDVTPQKQAEEQIRSQNAFLNNVIESLRHPFMVINAKDFKVQIANQAARRKRLAPGDLCHQINYGQDHPCSRSGRRCPVEEVVRTHRPVNLEYHHTDENGHESMHEEVHAFPLFDDDGHVKQVIQYRLDITHRKRLEAVAEAANLMENLGFIFSGIRHEIGNPINSIKMALSVLSANIERYPLATVREFLDRSMGEITRVEYLLKSLKSFSMYENPEAEPVEMKPFLDKFLSLVAQDFSKKGISITETVEPQDIVALCDPRMLHQVLLNLITNAADALDEINNPEIRVAINQIRDNVQIQVIDNGCGMTPPEQQNLFRPFYTSKPHGTGLGLVIVRKMLSKMGGTVRVNSTAGIGTTVTMLLPYEEK